MFVCVHSTVLGPAGGGTRMRVYPAPADGLADVMRLSGGDDVEDGRRRDCRAAAARPCSRCRSCRPASRGKRLLRRYGELVASLGGTYRTAGDMNISPEDLDVVAETCPWVYGTTGRGGDSGRGTARGALHAIRATVEHVFGSPDLAGRSVLVQGVGAVGASARARARGRRRARARERRRRVARRGDRLRDGSRRTRVLETEVDVYSPCAVGGTLNARDDPAPRLPRDRRLREQPARRARGRRAPARARHPLRARLRRQRRRRSSS